MPAITVYCSSSSTVAPVYFNHARKLGELMAHSGYDLVYGGTNVGLMGVIAQTVRENSGKTIGIIPEAIASKGIANPDDHEQHLVADMRIRKGKMDEMGDAFIALPGGFGTLEELFEVITSKQLGYHQKPITLINTAGYFNKLIDFINHSIDQQFVKPQMTQLYKVAETPKQAMEYIQSYQVIQLPTKWTQPD